MIRKSFWLATLAMTAAVTAQASDTRVVVSIENLAPNAGTFQTPFSS